MKIKLVQIITVVYLILISIITKDINFVAWGFLAIALIVSYFLNKNEIFNSVENLIYIVIALIPFSFLLSLFMIYLPFAVFGILITKKGFLKNYILGFGVSYSY